MAEYLIFSLYVLVAVVCLYGTGLFLWWWRKNKWRATTMYMYITVLLATLGFRGILDSIAYWQRVIKVDGVVTIYDNWLWIMRIVIVLIIVILLVGHMSYRAFYLRKRNEDDGDTK